MIGRTLGLPLSATLADLVRGIGSGRQGDLPATPAPGRAMHVGYALLAALAIPIVLLTAERHLGPSMRYLDVVALSGVYAAATIGLLFVPWQRLDRRWSFAGVALPVVFISSLSALTGGGSSPYSALYAPVLAIAGWYLPLGQVATVIALVVTTELWRATALDGSRSVEQLAVMLPFDVAVAAAAWASSSWLRASLTSTRLDQIRMAATLDAIRELGVDPESNILSEVAKSMGRVFDARATVVTLSTSRPAGRMVTPVLLEGNVATVLVPGSKKLHALVTLEGRRPFSSHELRLAAILAEAAGRTLDAREAMTRTRAETERDPLTGLLNRRALDRDLANALETAEGKPSSVALLFVDLDDFKQLNDQYGHIAGDAVLARLAALLRRAARRPDRVYRFGGDEFAVLLRNASDKEALQVGQRLLTAISSPGRRAGDLRLPRVQASIGVAVAQPGWTPAELLEAADSAMYSAKTAGGGVARIDEAAGGRDVEGGDMPAFAPAS